MAFRFDNMDEATGAFFARQLEAIRPRTMDVKLVGLIARDLIPPDFSVSPGAESVTYYQYEGIGVARIMKSYADNIPRSDVKGRQFNANIRSVTSSYVYNFQEGRAALLAGVPLDQKKANAARRAIEEKLDEIARIGSAEDGLIGWFNQPNVGAYTIPNGATSHPEWPTKTGDEIVADLSGIERAIVSQSKGVEIPDTLVISQRAFGLISTKRMGTVSDMTILKYALENLAYIKRIVPWVHLEGAGDDGDDLMICYRRDPDAFQLVIPQDFEQLPPQQIGMGIYTICHARCGGVQVYYPLSMLYASHYYAPPD